MLNKYYFFLGINTGTPPTPPAPLYVSLANSSGNLIATISGGSPPYSYNFWMSYTGTCHGGNITNPTGTTSSTTVSTPFSFVAYGSTTYRFEVDITDNTGAFVQSHIFITPCLVPESLITLKNGTQKELGKLKVGEELFGENNKVESFETYHVSTLYNINEGLLKSSIGHIHLINGGQQVQALELKVGDKFKNIKEEEIEIYSIEKQQGNFKVINISTTNKTYVANGIYTHNKLPCGS
jgi:hypothetical protein